MQMSNYCPTKMSFPCNSWILLSSKHIENQMVNVFLEKWQNDMIYLKEKIQEEIRGEKEELGALPFLRMINSLFALSEKSSKEEYQLALDNLLASKRPNRDDPFTNQLEHLEHLLVQAVNHFPPTPLQASSLLETLEKLYEILYPHDSYKKVN